MTDLLATSPVIQALGYALIAFLWQGAAIGALTAVLAVACRRASAETRYLFACLGLAALALAPAITVLDHLQERPTAANRAIANPTQETAAGLALATSATVGASQQDEGSARDPRMSIVVLVWSVGVVLLGLQLVRGGVLVARMRRCASPLVSLDQIEVLTRLAKRLSVSVDVRLFRSAAIEVPAVIGWLRPAIIVPASALAGLSPDYFEAILAHELAHVRRRDYLVNIAQRVVETLLFYHPAVWWVSGWIRREREYCCDDLAASVSGNRAAYAHALRALEVLRASTPALAMGARGGELVTRIRRLVGGSSDALPNWPGGLAMIVPAIAFFTIGSFTAGGSVSALPRIPPERVQATTSVAVPAEMPAPVPTPSSTAVRAPAPVRPARAVTPQAAAVTGTVVDQMGGVIPGATVALRPQTASEARMATTRATGSFAFDDVPAGDYELTVTQPGFRTSRNSIHVPAAQAAPITILLHLGIVAEETTVTGSPGVAVNPEGQLPASLQSSADYFAAARYYYSREAFADADAMTARAVELTHAGPAAPVQAYAAPGVVRVGGSIREPRKLRDVRPIYPAADLAARTQGVVIIKAVISGDGTVTDAVIASAASSLDDSALGAVRQWLFSPTLLNGAPVDVDMTVTINFRIR